MTKRKKFLLTVLLLLLLLGGYELACRRAVQVTRIIEGTQTGEIAQWVEGLSGHGMFVEEKDANTTWVYVSLGLNGYSQMRFRGKASLLFGILDLRFTPHMAVNDHVATYYLAELKHPPVQYVRAEVAAEKQQVDAVSPENPLPYWEQARLPEPPNRFYQWFSYVLGMTK